MRSKAEEMTRKLSRHFLNSPPVIHGNVEEPIEINSEYQDETEISSPNVRKDSSIGPLVTVKECRFSLMY